MAEASDELVEVDVEVVNSQGLHARPAHQIVLTANKFPCTIRVVKDGTDVDAKSIMELMMLAAEKGVTLSIRAQGGQADEAVAALKDLFASGFGED